MKRKRVRSKEVRTRRGRDGVGREASEYCLTCGVHRGKREDESLLCELCETVKYSGVWHRNIGRQGDGAGDTEAG